MPRLIDLTHPMRDNQRAFGTDPPLEYEPIAESDDEGFQLTRLLLSAHHGTHVDAPLHYLQRGADIASLNLSVFYGTAVCIRIPKSADESIDVDDLEPHRDGFTAGGKVLIETGHHKEFGKNDFFSEYPSLTVEATEWIADSRIELLGIDTPSPSQDFDPVHKALLGAEQPVTILESLANLHRCPKRFTLSAFPLRMTKCEGSPVRAVAICDEE